MHRAELRLARREHLAVTRLRSGLPRCLFAFVEPLLPLSSLTEILATADERRKSRVRRARAAPALLVLATGAWRVEVDNEVALGDVHAFLDD